MPRNIIRILTSSDRGEATLWNASGMLVGSYTIRGTETEITAPSESGIYILNVRLSNGKGDTFKIVVKK